MNAKIPSLTLAAWLFATLSTFGQPTITRQPTDQSVSVGANASFSITASGLAPLIYRWHFNDTELVGATNRTLALTNVQVVLGGNYAAVVSDSSGSVTSRVAVLEVDPSFTKITDSPIVKDTADGEGAAWVDIDNDGDLDLSVVSSDTPVHLLYRNDGNSGFVQVQDGVLPREGAGAETSAWVDIDNDKLLDVFLSKSTGHLFRQSPAGTFVRSVLGAPGLDWGVGAADFDNDGFVDLVVRSTDPRKSVWLNNRMGGFAALSNNSVATSATSSIAAADFDNDGDSDFFVSRGRLYRNDGNGIFTPITTGSLAQQGSNGTEAAWGDYDNDGDLDLFLARIDGNFQQPLPPYLFRNNGDGTFTRIDEPPLNQGLAFAPSGSWGDYDNDGWLDLFLVDFLGLKNLLFHNNGDGTFHRILSGSIANDNGSSTSGVWGDYNRDGFLDLFVANGANGGGEVSDYLYRNNGNSNSWLTVKCVGTVSNRSAIGAKVRAKATINGKSIWQLREINTGGGWTQNPLETHFGLGNAASVETLRIEWPSGTVQEMSNVKAKQLLTIIEPPRLQIATPQTGNPAKLTVQSGVGFSYVLEISEDLRNWTSLRTNIAAGLTLEFEDADAANFSRHFYRARLLETQ